MTEPNRAPQTFDEIEALREGWDFEAKKAAGKDGRGTVPASFWETYSAMANADGGIVALGIKENPDHSLVFHGIENPGKVERVLWDQLQNREKVSANILERSDISRIEEQGRVVVILSIPRAARSQRPIYLGRDPLSGTYIRMEEGDRKVTADRVKRMLADAATENPIDGSVLEHYSFDDLSPESVNGYRNLFRSHRADHAFLRGDDISFLTSIRAWGHDRSIGIDGPTVAGLLLLGKENAIRDRFPHWHLSYREMPLENNSMERWVDRISPDGTWNANLFEFYMRVIRKLHHGLKVPFSLDAELFRRDETHVHQAVREAFVNTLVHADYNGRAGIRVLRYPKHFEFINTGGLLIPAAQIWQGGVSECRNATLQHLFGLVQLGEREGSGGPTIRHAWQEQHWRAPGIREDRQLNETRLTLSTESFLPEKEVEEVSLYMGAQWQELDSPARVALVTTFIEGQVNHRRLSEVVEMHPRDLTMLLQNFVRQGFMERMGHGKSCTYRLNQIRLQSRFTHKDSNSHHKDKDSTKTALELMQHRKRVSPELLKAAILEICSDSPKTSGEIAQILGRSENTIKNHHLRELLRDDSLMLQFPDTPNHPRQAYLTQKPRHGFALNKV
ncbi:putative DNA binding domain-containing protein [Myxococcota bacterium]|nr:putative DNA binding domain-containing protein [Myxococcota bacterium]